MSAINLVDGTEVKSVVVAESPVHQFLVVVPVQPAGVQSAAKEHFKWLHVLGVEWNLVKSLSVGFGYGGYIFWALEAAFDLERIYADFFEFGQLGEGAQVTGAKEVLGVGVAVFLSVHKNAVGKSAALGALAAVGAATAKVFAGQALARVAHAKRPVNEYFEFQVGGGFDGGNFFD